MLACRWNFSAIYGLGKSAGCGARASAGLRRGAGGRSAVGLVQEMRFALAVLEGAACACVPLQALAGLILSEKIPRQKLNYVHRGLVNIKYSLKAA